MIKIINTSRFVQSVFINHAVGSQEKHSVT